MPPTPGLASDSSSHLPARTYMAMFKKRDRQGKRRLAAMNKEIGFDYVHVPPQPPPAEPVVEQLPPSEKLRAFQINQRNEMKRWKARKLSKLLVEVD